MLTHDQAANSFTYDPETGVLVRKDDGTNRVQARFIGVPVGTLDDNGYLGLKFQSKTYRVHQVAVLLMTGHWPEYVDHINGKRTDNRWSNLRESTQKENVRNQWREGGPLMGTTKRGKKWSAQIRVDGKIRALGTYATEVEAHAAYVAAKKELHPEWDSSRADASSLP